MPIVLGSYLEKADSPHVAVEVGGGDRTKRYSRTLPRESPGSKMPNQEIHIFRGLSHSAEYPMSVPACAQTAPERRSSLPVWNHMLVPKSRRLCPGRRLKT